MAIFREIHVKTTPSAVYEFPNELFFEGQSHNATTLTPLMNRTLSNETSSSSNAIVTMSNKMWFNQNTLSNFQGNLQLRDFSLTDGGKGKMNFVYPMVYQENRVLTTPMTSVYRSPPTSTLAFYDTTTLNRVATLGPGLDLNGTTNVGLIYGETVDNIFFSYVPVNTGTNTFEYSYLNYIINPDQMTSTNVWNFERYTGSGAFVTNTLVDETSDYFYFMTVYPTTGPGSPSYTLSYQRKSTGAMTSYTAAQSPLSAAGPICWSSSAINTGATTRAVFVPEFASTGGSQWNFAVTTYDTNDVTIPPVTTTVEPTGASGMPGSVYPGATPTAANWRMSVFKCWNFNVGNTTYVCVGAFFLSQTETTNIPPVSNYYIHVYKCPTNNPSNLQYVSSTYLGGTGRPLGILPLNNNASQLAVPYPGSVQFVSWSQGTESYILGDELSKSPLTMGVDQTGRLWVTATDGTLNVFSSTISGTVTVAFQNPDVVYNGSVINTNLLVNSYNFAGNRVVSPVTLQIDSNSCTFDDGSLTKTVNTLTSGDLLVPIKLIGAGYIRIIANISI